MLNLSNANRLYTDTEILGEFATYVYSKGLKGKQLDDAVDMLSKIVAHDPDFIKGFVGRHIRDLERNTR